MNASIVRQLFAILFLAALYGHVKGQDTLDVPAGTTTTLQGTTDLGSGAGSGSDGLITVDTNAKLLISDGAHLDDGNSHSDTSGAAGGNGTISLASGAALSFGSGDEAQVGGSGGNGGNSGLFGAGGSGGNGMVTLAPGSTVDLSKTSSILLGGNGGNGSSGPDNHGGNGGNGGLIVGMGSTLTVENHLVIGGGELGLFSNPNSLVVGGSGGVVASPVSNSSTSVVTSNFAVLPPEINSGRIFAGSGSGPLQEAATAWEDLAAELNTTASNYSQVVTGLTADQWNGPVSTPVSPYVSWLDVSATQAEQAAAQANASAAAYENAFSSVVPPPLIAANRAQLSNLIATNFLGQNNTAISQIETQYAEMWAQDATAMYNYAGQSAYAVGSVKPAAISAPTLNTSAILVNEANYLEMWAQDAAAMYGYEVDAGISNKSISTQQAAQYAQMWEQDSQAMYAFAKGEGVDDGISGSGTFELDGGTLQIGGINGISEGAGAATFNLAGGTIQVIGSDLTTFVPMTLSSTSTIDTHGFNAVFFGIFSGDGSLNKTGLGIGALFGANTYTSGTTLSEGILQADNAGAFGTGPINFAGGTLQYGVGITHDFSNQFSTADNQQYLIDPNGNDITFASSLSSHGGSLTLIGSGELILSGTNTYSGGTTIKGGILAIANPAALGSGGMFVTGGVLATAGSNHLITVNGPYAQSSNGTLALNIAGQSVHDVLSVNGSATLSGTLELNLVGGFVPGKGESFTVVTTSDPINGKFTSVISNFRAIGVTVDYTNDMAVAQFGQLSFANLSGVTYTPNQRSVAAYIDLQDLTSSSTGFTNLVSVLNDISDNASELAGGFDQLNPLKFGNFTSSTAFNNASFTVQGLDDYLANHRGADGTFVGSDGGIDYSGLAINDPNIDTGLQSVRSRLLAWSPAPSTGLLSDSGNLVLGGVDMKDVATQSGPTNLWNVFITGNVVLAQDFSNNAVGIPYASSTTGAAEIGADYRITPHLLVGVAFGYGHTHANLDTIGSNANVNTYSPAVYLSYIDSGWYFNALGSYGFSDYSQNRNVAIGAFTGTAHSSPGGDQILGNLDGGYDFHRGNWTLGPTLGVQYTHLDVDGYTETGLPGADLTVNSNQADSLRSHLGGRVSYAVKSGTTLFTPHLSASWQHEFMDQSRGITSQFSDVGAGSFVVNTSNPSRDSALVDLGLDAQINNTITVFSDYSVQAGQSNYFGQSVQAGVKIGF